MTIWLKDPAERKNKLFKLILMPHFKNLTNALYIYFFFLTRGVNSNEENLPQMYLNEARGWVRQNWISAKKWFYKKVVLRDDYVPQFDDFSEANKNRNKSDKLINNLRLKLTNIF